MSIFHQPPNALSKPKNGGGPTATVLFAKIRSDQAGGDSSPCPLSVPPLSDSVEVLLPDASLDAALSSSASGPLEPRQQCLHHASAVLAFRFQMEIEVFGAAA